ncbi:hypothetical protein O3P69_004235 [Scylla paramamosain]|uniref:Uncharacterized protein n=1 Tax=Scylla paramamosain TaxID=85552 RepID=A0AAW0UFQ1_SCYPA
MTILANLVPSRLKPEVHFLQWDQWFQLEIESVEIGGPLDTTPSVSLLLLVNEDGCINVNRSGLLGVKDVFKRTHGVTVQGGLCHAVKTWRGRMHYSGRLVINHSLSSS